jgi:enamine deaminase RidA (YjgF/YER057c/UK114 family)
VLCPMPFKVSLVEIDHVLLRSFVNCSNFSVSGQTSVISTAIRTFSSDNKHLPFHLSVLPKQIAHTRKLLSLFSLQHQHCLMPIKNGTLNMTEDNKPRTLNPEGIPLPPPTYNHLCITSLIPGSVDLVTLAGLTGIDASSSANPKAIPEQARIAYQKIKTCLAAAKATPRDIVQVRHYIVKETGDPDVDKLDVVERGWGEAWIEFMDSEAGGHRPPDTVVGVASLATKDILYECEVWAVVRK